MILHQIKNYIKDHKQVTLKEVSDHFKIPRDAVEAMTSIWIKKGLIEKSFDGCYSTSCGQCPIHQKEIIYRDCLAVI